jgi:putative transposase
VYEIKNDTDLLSYCERRPNDWKCIDGRYVHLPVRQYFEKMGIEHIVVPNGTMNAVRADNLSLLISVRLVDDTPRLQKLRTKIKKIFRSVDIIRIGQILDCLNIEDATAVFQLIDEEYLHADLDNCFLALPRNVWISTKPGLTTLLNDRGFRFSEQIEICPSLPTSELAEPNHLVEFASRLAACGLIPYVDGLKRKAARTVRRYKEILEDNNGDPSSLNPHWDRCGNRGQRFEEAHQKLMYKVIASAKSDSNHSSIAGGWREYQLLFNSLQTVHDDKCASERTFYNYYHGFKSDIDLAKQRGGRRASNAAADPIDPTRRVLCPMRPFAVAHVDHYEFDMALVVGETSEGNVVTERAWVTAMVDAFSGEVLAVWVTFRKPCAESCAMVVRDCIWRHGKLPEVLVVDGGPEFDSIHFTTLLATLNITRIERPPEDPRFGKEVERLFGTFKECFARGLPGFVPGIAFSRKVSGKWSPAKRARLELYELIDILEIYIFQGYNNEPTPGTITSRYASRAKSEAVLPFGGRRVVLDTRFLILTATPAPANCYQLAAGRGIRVYGHWYSCRALLHYAGAKKYVEVRVEPFDSSIVYVCVSHRWHVCRSSNTTLHRGLSESEVIAKTTEHQHLRQLKKAITLQAQQDSYQRKMVAYEGALASRAESNDSAVQPKTTLHETSDRKEKRTRFEHIGDLVMDEEAL